MKILLYVVILGLVINLLANMIWKYIPSSSKHVDKIATFALITVCVLLLISQKPETTDSNNQKSAKGINIKNLETESGDVKVENVQGDKIINIGTDVDDELVREDYLQFKIDKSGWMNLGGSKWGYGRLFSFTLSNPTKRLAIVKRIYLLVEKIEKDLVGGPEGQFTEYKYEVLLSPKRTGAYEIASDFKYGHNDVDRISVDVKTEKFGFDYFFRIFVEWHDSEDGKLRTIKSDLLRARFPLNHGPNRRSTFNEGPALGLIGIFEEKPSLLLENDTISNNPKLYNLFVENHEFWEQNPSLFLLYYNDTGLFVKIAESCNYRLDDIKKRVNELLR